MRGRITGIVYLLFFVTAIAGAVVAPPISGVRGISGDGATIANYVTTHEASVRLALGLGLLSTACYVALIALFYQLFRPVSRTLALLALAFGLMGCAVMAFGTLFQAAPLVVLHGDGYLSAFDQKQLQAMALMFLKLGVVVGSVALIFFGFFQLALGYLIWRSSFLPRVLGVLIALAGVGWLTYLSPPLATRLTTYLEVLGALSELGLMLWLLVMGVDSQRWIERAVADARRLSASSR